MEEARPLDFNVFGEQLNSLIVAAGNQLAREWPVRYQNVSGARELFVMHLRIARLAYRSVLYLGGDIPVDVRRLPEFGLSLPVLNRSILDSLLTIMFLLENVPERTEWFYESNWKAVRLEYDRYVAEYGQSTAPEWQEYLQKLRTLCDIGLKSVNLTAAQIAAPTGLRAWLNPGQMVRFQVSPNAVLPPNRAFMKYLDDFYYIDLSQQVHLGAAGIVKRGSFVLDEIQSSPDFDEQLRRYRLGQIGVSVVFLLALLSEIELHFDFGLRERALYVWNTARSVIVAVDEAYRKRYVNMF